MRSNQMGRKNQSNAKGRANRWAVEMMEKRVLLSTVIVNSTIDTLFAPGSGNVSLRNAIAIANAATEPTTIRFDSVLFATPQTIALSGTHLQFTNTAQPTSIVGPAAGVTIDAQRSSGVLLVDSNVDVSMSDLTITNASHTPNDYDWYNPLDYGRGLAVGSSCVIDLTRVAITNNLSFGTPSGLYIDSSSVVTMVDCVVSGNSGTFGAPVGGIFVGTAAVLNMQGVQVLANSGSDCGGMLVNGATVNMTNVVFQQNTGGPATAIATWGNSVVSADTVSFDGLRPVSNNGTQMTLKNAVFSGCECSAVTNTGAMTINGALFENNYVESDPGIINNSGSMTLSGNVSIIGTDSLFDGAGIFNSGTLNTSGTVSLLIERFVSGNGAGVRNTGTMSLDHAIIRNNTATGEGGGIYNSGTITISNSQILANASSGSGAGIRNTGSASIIDSTVQANTGGGGISSGANLLQSSLVLKNVKVLDNTCSSWGGGVDVWFGSANLDRVTIAGNQASDVGGGIANTCPSLIITNSTISNNRTTSTRGDGGGIFNPGTVTLINCTVSGNTATGDGGGINGYGHFHIFDCTIADNHAGYTGGGLFYADPDRVFELANTIIANNTAPQGNPDVHDLFANIRSLGNNLVGSDSSGLTHWKSTDLVGSAAAPIDPKLTALLEHGGPTKTMMLLPGSPALDRGSNALIPAGIKTDQRGLPRIINGIVDIGADERVAQITLPAAPSELLVERPGTTQVKLRWLDNSVNESGFKIQMATSATGPWTLIRTTGANTTLATISNLQAGVVYFFRICATNALGDSAFTPVVSTANSPAKISGTLYEDKNGNGLRDNGEGVLVSSMVYIDANNNGIFDTGEKATLTDSSGRYAFILPAGTYVVRKFLRPGFFITQPVSGAYAIGLATGQVSQGNDFGHAQLASFSENFNNGTLGMYLQDTYGKFTITNGQVHLANPDGDPTDATRYYIRTKASVIGDFQFDITYSATSITFIGIGKGLRSSAYFEPADDSLYLRLHSPALAGGVALAFDGPFNTVKLVGDVNSTGLHRTRITRTGDVMSFAIDEQVAGDFAPELVYALNLNDRPDIKAALSGESRLFFGTGEYASVFDDVKLALK